MRLLGVTWEGMAARSLDRDAAARDGHRARFQVRTPLRAHASRRACVGCAGCAGCARACVRWETSSGLLSFYLAPLVVAARSTRAVRQRRLAALLARDELDGRDFVVV